MRSTGAYFVARVILARMLWRAFLSVHIGDTRKIEYPGERKFLRYMRSLSVPFLSHVMNMVAEARKLGRKCWWHPQGGMNRREPEAAMQVFFHGTSRCMFRSFPATSETRMNPRVATPRQWGRVRNR